MSRENRAWTRMLYKDASDLSATSRACQVYGISRTTRHTDKRTETTLQQTAGRPIRPDKLNGQVARKSGVSQRVGKDVMMMLYDDAAKKLLPWNSSFTIHPTNYVQNGHKPKRPH